MAKQLILRKGDTDEHNTDKGDGSGFTGVVAEVTVDTDKKTVCVHDNSTVGGNPLFQANNDVIMLTTTKVQQRGAFLQSSTHQSMVLGY